MNNFDFNNKTFALLENSENGKVSRDTVFEFKQDDDLVTADYYGGSIRYGKIISELKGKQLNMLYQCMTVDNELKAGKAIADISFNENGKIMLRLAWEWLGDQQKKGVSEYVEV